jgi:hypothetical protein
MPVVEVVLERPYLPRTIATYDLDAPIRFMTDEHILIRETFEWLRLSGDANWCGDRPALAGALLDYLHRDFPQHCEDEQLVCEFISESTGGSAQLTQLHGIVDRSHAAFAGLLRQLSCCLEALAAGDPVPESAPYLNLVRSFRVVGNLHMAWEEKRLLPVAVALLGRDLLQRLGDLMARRRGLRASYPAGPSWQAELRLC